MKYVTITSVFPTDTVQTCNELEALVHLPCARQVWTVELRPPEKIAVFASPCGDRYYHPECLSELILSSWGVRTLAGRVLAGKEKSLFHPSPGKRSGPPSASRVGVYAHFARKTRSALDAWRGVHPCPPGRKSTFPAYATWRGTPEWPLSPLENVFHAPDRGGALHTYLSSKTEPPTALVEPVVKYFTSPYIHVRRARYAAPR